MNSTDNQGQQTWKLMDIYIVNGQLMRLYIQIYIYIYVVMYKKICIAYCDYVSTNIHM